MSCALASLQALSSAESFTGAMNTDATGLVSFDWATRAGYGYEVETSPDLTHWQPLASFHGNGATFSLPVAQIAPPGQPVPPPSPANPLHSAHFALRIFPDQARTLIAWTQPGSTVLSQALVSADLRNLTDLPLFVGKFTDAPNATDYLLSFTFVSGPFHADFEAFTLAALTTEESGHLAWFTDRLEEARLAMVDAQASGRMSNSLPTTAAGTSGGVEVFFRVIESYLDSDGDGLYDHHEIGYVGSDPWLSDSDHDGYTDKEEFDAGSDPHDAASTPGTGGGTPPTEVLPEEDFDQDGIANDLDADPLDPNVDWGKRGFPHFAILQIPGAVGLIPQAVNNNGEVVLNTPYLEDGYYWKPGQALPTPLAIGDLEIETMLYDDEDENGDPVLLPFTFRIVRAEAHDINDAGQIVGSGLFLAPGNSGSTTYPAGYGLTVALQWANGSATPTLVHPGKIDAAEWGTLILNSGALEINEQGTIRGWAEYAVPAGDPEAKPPFERRSVPTLWTAVRIGLEGLELFAPGATPSPPPVITSMARDASFFTGSSGVAAYWEEWKRLPTHTFLPAGYETVRLSALPNGRPGLAGNQRLMLFSKTGRWEPALRTYDGAFDLTTDGTVWFHSTGQPALWHPLKHCTLTALNSVHGHEFGYVNDVASSGVAVAQTNHSKALLLPVEIVPDAGMAGVIGDVVESAKEHSTVLHFVTPKQSANLDQEYVVLRATGVRPEQITPGHPEQIVEWVATGGEAVPGEPLKWRVPRASVGMTEVRIHSTSPGWNSGAAVHMNVWVVWVDFTARMSGASAMFPSVPLGVDDFRDEFHPDGPRYEIEANTEFIGTITPLSIITALERPALEKQKRQVPPGNDSGVAFIPDNPDVSNAGFSGWDVSRQITRRVRLGPMLVPPGPGGHYDDIHMPLDYPGNPVEANDDRRVDDEDSNPYESVIAPIGQVGSLDTPTTAITDDLTSTGDVPATDGDRLEVNRWFREFARVQIGSHWFLVSEYQPWRFAIQLERVDGKWQSEIPAVLELNNEELP